MFKESVGVEITRATLELLGAQRGESATAMWLAFREWEAARGREVAYSYVEKPPFYEDLQDLYEFATTCCPDLGRLGMLEQSGRRFAEIILAEHLPDLVVTLRTKAANLVTSIQYLYSRTLDRYSRYLLSSEVEPLATGLRCELSFTEPEAVARHLGRFGLDARRSFENTFLFIVATTGGCMEYLLEPWSSTDHLSADLKRGVFRLTVPAGTEFNYRRLVYTLTQHASELHDVYRDKLFTRDLEHDLIHESSVMRDKWEKIKLASETDELILLRGEPGTGKTHLAERMHEMSERKGRRFVEVGLTADLGTDSLVQSHLFGHVKGAFTSAHEDKPGLFTRADQGTIFLDEIGDASPEVQAKLLRVIEKKTFKPLGSTQDVEVDVRIIAATNRNLEAMVREGTFREDLYYRINVIQIELPPVRDRADEVPLLCEHFIRMVAVDIRKAPKPLAAEVLVWAANYPWPGNFREMIHVLKYALIFSKGPVIELRDLPDTVRKATFEPARARASAPADLPANGVVDEPMLRHLLAQQDRPVISGDTADCPVHVDYARKIYLRALIDHCHGNLRLISMHWDRESQRAVRASIERFGLVDTLEAARRREARLERSK